VEGLYVSETVWGLRTGGFDCILGDEQRLVTEVERTLVVVVLVWHSGGLDFPFHTVELVIELWLLALCRGGCLLSVIGCRFFDP
jgi:hypothetical protein